MADGCSLPLALATLQEDDSSLSLHELKEMLQGSYKMNDVPQSGVASKEVSCPCTWAGRRGPVTHREGPAAGPVWGASNRRSSRAALFLRGPYDPSSPSERCCLRSAVSRSAARRTCL